MLGYELKELFDFDALTVTLAIGLPLFTAIMYLVLKTDFRNDERLRKKHADERMADS